MELGGTPDNGKATSVVRFPVRNVSQCRMEKSRQGSLRASLLPEAGSAFTAPDSSSVAGSPVSQRSQANAKPLRLAR